MNNAFVALADGKWSDIGNVRVLNLVDPNTGRQQTVSIDARSRAHDNDSLRPRPDRPGGPEEEGVADQTITFCGIWRQAFEPAAFFMCSSLPRVSGARPTSVSLSAVSGPPLH